jgi:hypothetical protein
MKEKYLVAIRDLKTGEVKMFEFKTKREQSSFFSAVNQYDIKNFEVIGTVTENGR